MKRKQQKEEVSRSSIYLVPSTPDRETRCSAMHFMGFLPKWRNQPDKRKPKNTLWTLPIDQFQTADIQPTFVLRSAKPRGREWLPCNRVAGGRCEYESEHVWAVCATPRHVRSVCGYQSATCEVTPAVLPAPIGALACKKMGKKEKRCDFEHAWCQNIHHFGVGHQLELVGYQTLEKRFQRRCLP